MCCVRVKYNARVSCSLSDEIKASFLFPSLRARDASFPFLFKHNKSPTSCMGDNRRKEIMVALFSKF